MGRAYLVRLIAVVSLAVSACTMHETEIPGVAGPSELALAVSVSAAPDSIVQDGFSQSSITISARDAYGQARANLQVQLNILVNGASASFGTLSQRTVFTNSEGRGFAVYTAPLAPTFQAGTPGNIVTIAATPVGNDYAVATSHYASVRVTPPAALPPVAGAPSASVGFSPAAPKVGEIVRFDASSSQAEGGHRIVSYVWDFGDTTPNDEHGSDGSHIYSSSGTFTMVLGVIDDVGRVGSTIKTIVVSN
jgi:hypothetical protein